MYYRNRSDKNRTIKIFYDEILKNPELSKISMGVLMAFVDESEINKGYPLKFISTMSIKKNISKLLDISINMVNKWISKLKKINFLMDSKTQGIYYINPKYFNI